MSEKNIKVSEQCHYKLSVYKATNGFSTMSEAMEDALKKAEESDEK